MACSPVHKHPRQLRSGFGPLGWVLWGLVIVRVLGPALRLEELSDTGKTEQFLRHQHGIVRPRVFLGFVVQITYLQVRLFGSEELGALQAIKDRRESLRR